MPLSFLAGPRVSERVAATGGHSSGFDFLRFALASAVILFHTAVTSQGPAAQKALNQSWLGPVLGLILPMFFALSGFLVAASLARNSVPVFLGLRALRIFPALVVQTLFCALLLGAAFTTLPLADYYAHPDLLAFLAGGFGWIHFTLPGVFQTLPVNMVNAQLWTIPVELECYGLLTVLGLLGLQRRRGWMLAVIGLLTLLLQARVLLGQSEPWAGRLLQLCFMGGVLCHQFRDRIRLSPAGALLALAASLLALTSPRLMYLAAWPVTYLTVWLGLLNPRKPRLLASGDYSYGLYVYGFPVQQLLVASVPLAREWYANALLALPLALVFAVLSWHLVEKPALACKPLLLRAQAAWNSRWARVGGRAGP